MSERLLTPDVVSHTAATSACEKGVQWEDALGLLHGTPQSARTPDVVSYTAATNACERACSGRQPFDCCEEYPRVC